MKKMIALLAALLMVWAAMPSLAAGQDAPVSAMLDQLAVFMDAREQIQGCLADCCRQAGAFYGRRDYASLIRARLACSGTLEYLRAFRAPEMTLDEDTLAALMRMKIEAIGLDDGAREIRTALEDGIGRVAAEEVFLHSYPIYLEEGLSAGEKVNESMRKRLALDAEYTCCRLNSLLLPVADDPDVIAFWDSLPDRWPVIAEYRQPWNSDPVSLTEACAAVVTELETLADEMAAAEGRNTYAIRHYAQDPEALAADFRWLQGSPANVLPLPAFWQESADKSLHANEGDAGTEDLPDVLTWYIPEVSAEDYSAYIRQLAELGFGEEITGSEQEGWKTTVGTAGKTMKIYWINGTVYIAWHPAQFAVEIR